MNIINPQTGKLEVEINPNEIGYFMSHLVTMLKNTFTFDKKSLISDIRQYENVIDFSPFYLKLSKTEQKQLLELVNNYYSTFVSVKNENKL